MKVIKFRGKGNKTGYYICSQLKPLKHKPHHSFREPCPPDRLHGIDRWFCRGQTVWSRYRVHRCKDSGRPPDLRAGRPRAAAVCHLQRAAPPQRRHPEARRAARYAHDDVPLKAQRANSKPQTACVASFPPQRPWGPIRRRRSLPR